MDLSSSELPNEIRKIIREDSVKKIVYHAKTDHVPTNYVVEMHDNENDTTNVNTGYTRYDMQHKNDSTRVCSDSEAYLY